MKDAYLAIIILITQEHQCPMSMGNTLRQGISICYLMPALQFLTFYSAVGPNLKEGFHPCDEFYKLQAQQYQL